MMMDIDVYDETGTLGKDHVEAVRRVIEKAGKSEGITGDAEVAVTFVNDDKIRALNRTYRDTDRATDVLSFALLDEGEGEPQIKGEGMPLVLGDIVISVPKARQQAERYEHSFMRELGFLAVHGFLHLCGYDHQTKEEEETMLAKQKDILESYGLKR
ncbi:MAG TPA: rRNA maturation RNase YbeY [Bacillales bacterium]|nr:rRNA maturation RNase YbeY [Bacillales bacterium]